MEVWNMRGKIKRKIREFVIKEGKPTAVILDIDEYKEMLERLEDIEDLKMLDKIRQKPMKFKKLSNFLKEYQTGV